MIRSPRTLRVRCRAARLSASRAILLPAIAWCGAAMLDALAGGVAVSASTVGELIGRVVDAATGEPLAARIYVQEESGAWRFVESADPNGSALPYDEEWVPMPGIVERHTTVSAHPFRVELPAGRHRVTVERGKSYFGRTLEVTVPDETSTQSLTIELTRWVDPESRGWYSGETHVHRRIAELPNVMEAEELSVAFPVTFWTIASDVVPNRTPSPLRSQGPSPFGDREDRGSEPIVVGPQRVIFPRNTEYEIFSVGDRRHVLGALFVLDHREPFELTAPPVAPIARRAHDDGALLDLDKHSWPWSAMLVPIAEVDLFELSNNSVWRAGFGFRSLPESLPPWHAFEQDGPDTLTEWGWLDYGFETYYALLDCGFRLRPTAGTASGVHPVPLGWSRVYVQVDGEFDGRRWLEGLDAGRSFVTTGPMLFATVDGQPPGTELQRTSDRTQVSIEAEVVSERPLERIELVRSGGTIEALAVQGEPTEVGAWRYVIRHRTTAGRTGWLALRAIERGEDGRRRFAHTAPWHVVVDDRPLVPRRAAAEYFAGQLERELERNRGVLFGEAFDEFVRAAAIYRELAERGE